MSSSDHSVNPPTFDLRRWRSVPTLAIVAGIFISLLGIVTAGSGHRSAQFGFSLLTVFAFYTSLVVGALFLVIIHHLVDASWSVVIRRICESMAVQSVCLFPLWILIYLFRKSIYPWFSIDPKMDSVLAAKAWLFNGFMWPLASLLILGIWYFYSTKLRFWSLRQDETGSVECTYKMRMLAYTGAVLALVVGITFGSIIWYKGIMYQWFSTMYGVWYFASSAWLTVATVYTITAALKVSGPLKDVATDKTFYFLGSLFFAFTVFYAYITFSQYFIIWNANVPEETFWYVLREKGSWFGVSMVIIFGHFFFPFLMLLRIDWKLKPKVIVPLAAWAWLMHYFDMQFNIMPELYPKGFHLAFLDIGLFLMVGGWMTNRFIRTLYSAPLYPQRDPRIAETMDVYVAPATVPGGAK